MLNAGDLNVRGRLERDVVTRVSGAEHKTPETYATPWASVAPLRGIEAFRAQQVSSNVDWIVRIRWRTDVEPNHRFIYGNARVRTLEIKAVQPNEADRDEVVLLCRSVN